MTLTKEELAERLIKGEKLYAVGNDEEHYCYFDSGYKMPFRYCCTNDMNVPMDLMWLETEWETYKEKPEWWTPKDGERAWYVTPAGDVSDSRVWEYETDISTIKQGNVFKTEEEAKKEVELRAAKYRVKKRIWELNGGEFLEFNPDISNYTFALIKDNDLASVWFTNKVCPNWQILKSKDLVEQLIEEMRDDLLLIRGE